MTAFLIDSMESKSVINALLRFRRIEKICKDQGTNLIEVNKLVISSNGLLQLEDVKDAPVDGQYRKNVERSVQILNKIVRMMRRTLESEVFPLLEKKEAMFLVESAYFQVNSIPYGMDNEDLFVCPNDKFDTYV